MTDETGLAAALRERYMTAYETGEAGPPNWDENARVARAWVNARLADPATVEAVIRGTCAVKAPKPPHETCVMAAEAALAAVRGLLGGAGGEG